MNQNIQDIKTKDLKKLFLKYLFPSVAGCLSTGVLVFIDTVFIGRGVGTLGLASLNISLPYFSIISFGMLLGVGGATAAAIDAGRGNFERKNSIFSAAVCLGIIFSISLSVIISLFLTEFAQFLGAQGETLPMVKDYVGVVSKFAAFYILPHTLNPFIRNDGNPNLSMISLAICCFFNCLLDYIFIFIFKWGMSGAALATGIAQLISTLVLLVHFGSNKNSLKFKRNFWDLGILKRIFSIGLASFINEVSMGVIIFVFNYFSFKFLGNEGVSSYSIMLNINLLIYLVCTGISQGAQPIISVNYGAKLHQRVDGVLKMALKLQFIFSLACYVILFIFRKGIILGFDRESLKVLAIASKAFPLFFLGTILWGINTQLSSFLQSIEHGRLSSAINFLRGFALILLNLFILSKLIGVNGVWLTPFFTEIFTLIIILLCFKIYLGNRFLKLY